MLYSTDYRILKSSWSFIKKSRDIWNIEHFQNSIVYYLLFDILVFLTSFFLFYLSIVVKQFLKFLYCFIVCIRGFNKEFSKTIVFLFSKNLRYLKSKISPKFHRLVFFFYTFSIFDIFFFHFLSKVVKKLWNFLLCFIGRIRDFINEFWKFLDVLLKNIDISNNLFFQNFAVYYLFFSNILFSISSICTCKKFWKFLFSFILWIWDLSKNFRKSWKIFLKKYRYLKSKILHKFHCLLFVSLALLTFFSYFAYPVYGFQKNWKIFVLFYCMHPRFYQKIEIFEIPNFTKFHLS